MAETDAQRGTGDDQAGADPGGTHSTKPTKPAENSSAKPPVQSGDQNDNPKRF